MVKIKKYLVCLLFAFICTASSFCSLLSWPKKMLITVPVADLRSDRSRAKDLTHLKKDSRQSSQLTFGEQIIANRKVGEYLHVSAIGQKVYDAVENDLVGCPGWIRADQAIDIEELGLKDFFEYNLAVKEKSAFITFKNNKKKKVLFGTRLYGIPIENNLFCVITPFGRGVIDASKVVYYKQLKTDERFLRKSICEAATRFLDGPYTWGGRSVYDKDLERKGQLTSTDCSNLVALCYKVYGLDIPRSARDQYESCKELYLGSELKPGDLVFTAQKTGSIYKIGHVLLFLGGDKLIESVGGRKRKVVITNGKKRFGRPVKELSYCSITKCGQIYLGSFFE